jgi:hypothetical protein
MVSPKTRGVRGRGTLLKKKAKRQLGSGLVAIICALFTVGISLEGISLTTMIDSSLNMLALVGLILGIIALATAFGLWREGHRLQKYWTRKKTISQRFRIKSKKRKKSKGNKKKK